MKQMVSAQHELNSIQSADSSEATNFSPSMQRQVDKSPRQLAQQEKFSHWRDDSAARGQGGLPLMLRAGIETLSGMDMSGVVVRRNSAQPAQLNALAYAQGSEIHLGPGQEKQLPHEAWHVVQQRQGRVRTTARANDVRINDDPGLEREADVMGQKALQLRAKRSMDGAALIAASSKREGTPYIQARFAAPIQLGKNGDGDKQEAGDKEISGQLVVRGNAQVNLVLLQRVWRFLPPVIQAFLNEAHATLEGLEEEASEPSSSAHGALVVRGREHDTPLVRMLNLDPRIIQNVVVGLYMMPTAQQKTLRGMDAPGLIRLFGQLAMAKHSPLLSLGAPSEGTRTGSTGAEHIQNSCYAAAILNLVARNADYRNMFNPLLNPAEPDSQARLMQDTISPLVQQIHTGGTVNAAQMQTLIARLNQAGLLMGEGDGEALEGEQQDASQVLMGIMNVIQPVHPLTTRETRTYDDGSPDHVQDESEFVLQVYAHGHRTLLDALRAHFVSDVHSSQIHAEAVDDPHRLTRTITAFPEVLSIGIVRLDEFDVIDMPRQFTVPASITHNGAPGPTYQLTAYVVRNTISHKTGGHYIAVIGNDDGTWDEMDDMGSPKEGGGGVWSPSTRRIDPSVHRVGDHHGPSYAMGTLYTYRRLQAHEVEQGGATIEFDSHWMTQHPVLSDLLMESGLTGKALKERERLIDKFLHSGGTIWDAYKLMASEPTDNGKLKKKFAELETTGHTLAYTESEASDPMVLGLLAGFASDSVEQILRLQAETQKHIEASPKHQDFLKKQLIALDVSLKEKRSKARKGYEKFLQEYGDNGSKVEIYGTERMLAVAKVKAWAGGIAQALVQAPFLASRVPPLQIRINLRPQVTKDIASTVGHGNIINVNMDDYQATHFTIGESLGLLAHELGVHSLDETTLSKDQLAEEDKDEATRMTGKHGGEKYSVGKDPTATGQQKDHLTIGRAVLGQLSGLPRLNMYEGTMLSILRAAQGDETKREIAAAYCIDIARILVLDDEAAKAGKAGFFDKIKIGKAIASAAAAEWVRIQKKYGKDFPEVLKIDLGFFGITGYLLRLSSVLEKINKEASGK